MVTDQPSSDPTDTVASHEERGSGAPGHGGNQVWRSLRRSGGARLLVLPVSALLGIVNTRLIIENFGTGAYAQYGLLVNIAALIPFADLGISAVLINAVAESASPADDERLRRVLTTALRTLVASAAALLGVVAVITALGAWPDLLGDGLLPGNGWLAAALCAGVIALSIPAGAGQRLLTGLGRNHISIAVLGLQTPIVLVTVLVLVATHTEAGSYLPVVPYLVTLGLAVGCTVLAARRLSPTFSVALRRVPHVRSQPGDRVLDVAWPMLLQMVALPIAMQTDRLVLSHVAGDTALAQYNLGSQLYSPVWQLVSSAGVALWPLFARARSTGRTAEVTSPLRLSLVFAALAIGLCGVLSAMAPWLTARASGGRIELSIGLMLAFSAFMVVQAAKYPLGMFLTDARGLRFQAFTIVLFLPVNLVLSVLLARTWGAAGPVVGSFVGVLCCQVVANWVYVRRRLRSDDTGALS